MRRIHLIVICGALAAAACSRTPAPSGGQAGAGAAAPVSDGARPAAAKTDAPALGEFDPLSEADVDLYLKVMRTAADRLAHLPAADREALNAYRRMAAGGGSDQAVSMTDVAAMQRATELLMLDNSVAGEMGVGKRYESISGRVQELTGPAADGGGDEPTTAEERARIREIGERIRQRNAKDAVVLQPHRAEILALQKKVNLVQHPESMPQ